MAGRIQIVKNAGYFFLSGPDSDHLSQMRRPLQPLAPDTIKAVRLVPDCQILCQSFRQRREQAVGRYLIAKAAQIGCPIQRRIGMGHTIDPKPHDRSQPSVFECLGFQQDAREFRSVDQQVVRPLQRHQLERTGSLVNGFGERNSRQKRQFADPSQWRRVDQQHTCEEISLRRGPGPPPSAPASSLNASPDPKVSRMPRNGPL